MYLDVWAYCLMPTHFHFLVRIKDIDKLREANKLNKYIPELLEKEIAADEILEEQFRKFFISYSQAINKQESRRGSLFQKRFKRIQVRDEEYITALIHYIHNNPVHHHIAKDLTGWKYSSYQAMITDKPTSLKRPEVLNWFGGKQYFLNFHQSSVEYSQLDKLIIE
jgi:putative transposase